MIAIRNRLLAIVLVGWVMIPAGWVLLNSVRPPLDQRTARVVPFLQFQPTLAHWRRWLTDDQLLRSLCDSAAVAACSTLIALCLGCPASYAAARFPYRRPSNADLVLFFLSQRILPPVVTVVPFYLLARWSGLFDSLVVLIIAHATFHLPLVVVLTYPRFRELPRSLEESAAIEGCSALRFFAAFALPAVGPTVGAAALVVLSFSWNEFLFSLLLTSRHVLPLTRLIQSAAENDWGIQLDAVAVIGLIAVAPPVVFGLVTFSVMARGLGLGRGG